MRIAKVANEMIDSIFTTQQPSQVLNHQRVERKTEDLECLLYYDCLAAKSRKPDLLQMGQAFACIMVLLDD